MINQILIELFERDLNALSKEINSYRNESDLWITKGEISNSAGNLCLHLIGNLNHFIGHLLGKTDYIRQRELEFSDRDVPVEKMLSMIEETIIVVRKTIEDLTQEDLAKNFPIKMFNREHSTLHFIMHLSTHLNYHLGQINYHRRIIGGIN